MWIPSRAASCELRAAVRRSVDVSCSRRAQHNGGSKDASEAGRYSCPASSCCDLQSSRESCSKPCLEPVLEQAWLSVSDREPSWSPAWVWLQESDCLCLVISHLAMPPRKIHELLLTSCDLT